MNDKEKREQLVRFLDDKAFDPILSKSDEDFSGKKKEKFQDVRKSTESEKQRFHNDYRTAKDVKDNYLSDLHSSTAKKKNGELEDLGLPRLPDFRDEFMRMCDDLDVR